MRYRILIASCMLLLILSTALAQAPQKVAVLNFEPEERAARTAANQIMHPRRGDFNALFDEYEQYQMIDQNTVNNALSSLGVTSVRYLTSQMAGDIGRELEADILIWGTVTEVSPTEVRMLANIMSVRSQNINQLRFNIRKRSSERIPVIRRELIEKISEFAGGEITRLFDIGGQQINSQNFSGARRSFQRIVEIEPDNVDAWFYLGYIAFMMRDYDASVEYCEAGLDIAPNDVRILNNMVEALLLVNRYDCAINALKRMADIETDEIVWLRIAEVYFEINDYYQAVASLRKALEINPESERAHHSLGVALFDNNEIEESIPHLQFIAEKRPEDDLINRKLTAAYMRTGKLDEAIANYRQQIERNPQNITAYLNLAGALRTKEQNREVLETLNRLLEIEKDNPTVYIRLSDVHISLNNLAEAEKNAEKARSLDSSLYEPYTLMAQVNQIRGYAKYEAFLDYEEKAKTAFGTEADNLIERRNRARSEAHELFQQADRQLVAALEHTTVPSIEREINSRRQLLEQLINETRRTFFD